NKNKSSVRLLIKQDRDAISIEVADTGRGIPPENLERIFDPGFTTKETGRGFGMPNLKSQIDAAGGELTVNSSTMGTTFRVRIPYVLLNC
ncbi:MAG TPA: ATP-binding protein, partial [Negativicutes bacterium]